MFGLNRAMVRAQNPALHKRCYPMHSGHGYMGKLHDFIVAIDCFHATVEVHKEKFKGKPFN